MSRSWDVFIESVDSLKKAEYRFGDLTERTGQKFLQTVASIASGKDNKALFPLCAVATNESHELSLADLESNPHGSASSLVLGAAVAEAEHQTARDSSARLGSVAVEAQVGAVKKRTLPFKVEGEALVPVGVTLLLPEPKQGQGMAVRLWRVGHFQEDALIGEGTVSEALGTPFRLVLTRKTGKGKDKGYVSMTVKLVDRDATPVSQVGAPKQATCGLVPSWVKEKHNRLVDKYMQGSIVPSDVHMREPLLQRPAEMPSAGECVVAIESVRELTARAARPYFVLSLDGQEFRTDPEQLVHAAEADLTYSFLFSSLNCNLCIYCYDDHAMARNNAIGRIIIPLSGVAWSVGKAPRLGLLKSAMNPKVGTLTQHFQAQFMPMGHSKASFVDRFQPARRRKDGKAVPGSGMYKKMAFGILTLRVDVTLTPSMSPPVKCYFSTVTSQLKALKCHREQEQEQSAAPQTLDLMGLMQSKVVTSALRNVERLDALLKAPPRGILRWVRSKPWHGLVAGLAWFAFCVLGLFPPPGWAWPLYVWATLVLNGVFVAFQRETDWKKMRDPAFPVWNEELEPATPALGDLVNAFTRGVRSLERSSRVVVGFLERLVNLFSFADGVVTVLFSLCLGLAALGLSVLIFLWGTWDPTGAWFSALLGFGLCMVLSNPRRQPPQNQPGQGPVEKKDPLGPLERLNMALECIPDQAELAHRYIASAVQCGLGFATLKVTIVSASGLRNADTLPGLGLSDPYCVCCVTGKENTRFQTKVVLDNLNPVWHHSEVVNSWAVGDSLDFRVYDQDIGLSDDLLGKAKLPSTSFYPRGFDGELELQEAGVGIKAMLRVRVEVDRRSLP